MTRPLNPLERTGNSFNLDLYLQARIVCKKVVQQIKNGVVLGMNEQDGQALIKEEFQKEGITKFWHPSKFRIGTDTVKTFRALPDTTVRLENDDIFFVDVGPVFEGHEADYGETFVYPEPLSNKTNSGLIAASKRVFNDVSNAWTNQKLIGQELYNYASRVTEDLGYSLNRQMGGHRLGDFPHALICKESLSQVEFTPVENLWVLEIHLVDLIRTRGAFYEDTLHHQAL